MTIAPRSPAVVRSTGVRVAGSGVHSKCVLNKYESNVWLDSSNAPGEWPVSYHGTGYYKARSIADEGFRLSMGKRFAYGRGIYSTPNVAVAEAYAKEFYADGVRYKVVLQHIILEGWYRYQIVV
jgi:hypothetical protein